MVGHSLARRKMRERKHFFFAKKKQKTFAEFDGAGCTATGPV
jgi:hypothetical protein